MQVLSPLTLRSGFESSTNTSEISRPASLEGELPLRTCRLSYTIPMRRGLPPRHVGALDGGAGGRPECGTQSGRFEGVPQPGPAGKCSSQAGAKSCDPKFRRPAYRAPGKGVGELAHVRGNGHPELVPKFSKGNPAD